MTPVEYYDWWLFSGICPGIPTRPANHAVLRERLSAPGVHLIILWELLLENADFEETSYIAPTGSYGSHERIVEAARDVGAMRLADYLYALRGTSVVPETHRELKKLLKHFAFRHKAELAADITRHGDPRALPGFDKRQARRKGDQQWGENNTRYQIADRIPFFTEPMNELRTFLTKGMTLPEISRQNEAMANCTAFRVPPHSGNCPGYCCESRRHSSRNRHGRSADRRADRLKARDMTENVTISPFLPEKE